MCVCVYVCVCIKLYNTLAVPVLLYGNETWTIKTREPEK